MHIAKFQTTPFFFTFHNLHYVINGKSKLRVCYDARQWVETGHSVKVKWMIENEQGDDNY